MTTTAHEDQYTVAPEPVRQPYDTVSILKQNVADLELALRTQTERAEAAEAEMTKARKQKPLTWGTSGELMDILKNPIYSSPAPVPAPAVPELDPMTRLIVSDPKQFKPKKQEPAVPYGIDEEAANRIALAVYDCKHGINQEPLLYAINRILATEAHPLSAEGQRSLLQSAEGSNAAADRRLGGVGNE